MRNSMRTGTIVAVAAAGVLVAGMSVSPPAHAGTKSGSSAPKVYKWVDANGVTHYGDQIPAEYANSDREVLNQQGVALRREAGASNAAHQAEAQRAAAEKAASAERDQVLLSTYLSVEEIEALRDRRMDLMNGQIKVTENYLVGLKGKLKTLQSEAAAFKPYSSDPAAAPIDEKLAGELADTMDSIARYEKTLRDTRNRQQQLAASFESDIARFKELQAPKTP